jgi:hypothetical protein
VPIEVSKSSYDDHVDTFIRATDSGRNGQLYSEPSVSLRRNLERNTRRLNRRWSCESCSVYVRAIFSGSRAGDFVSSAGIKCVSFCASSWP